MTKPKTNPHLKDFWLTRGVRYRILYGGRSSTKTWDATSRLINLSSRYKMRVLCVRRYQNRIDDSVYEALKQQIDRFGMHRHFDMRATRLYGRNTGSEFAFYGIERHPADIKGFEGADILYIEEAQHITEAQWKILQPTIRKQGSEIWVVFNPEMVMDFSYQNFVVNPPANALVRKINYDENPFLSDTALSDIEQMKIRDPDGYDHVYLGNPLMDDEASIIKRRWLESCKDAYKKLGLEIAGRRRVGFDLADEGEDLNATATVHGGHCYRLDEWKGGEDELLQSCRRAWNTALLEGCREIIYDSIGVGAHAGAVFKELNEKPDVRVRIKHRKFNAAAKVAAPNIEYKPKVKNVDHFANLKSQAWQMVSDAARDTHAMIEGRIPIDFDRVLSLDSSMPLLERLITELSTPKRRYSEMGGRQLVESKKELKARNVPSHNLADAYVMAAAVLPADVPKMQVGRYGVR